MADSAERLAVLARELATLEPEQRRKVISKLRAAAITCDAVSDGQLTARTLGVLTDFLETS